MPSPRQIILYIEENESTFEENFNKNFIFCLDEYEKLPKNDLKRLAFTKWLSSCLVYKGEDNIKFIKKVGEKYREGNQEECLKLDRLIPYISECNTFVYFYFQFNKLIGLRNLKDKRSLTKRLKKDDVLKRVLSGISKEIVDVLCDESIVTHCRHKKVCLDNAIAEYHGEETDGTDMETITTNRFIKLLNGEYEGNRASLVKFISRSEYNSQCSTIAKNVFNVLCKDKSHYGGSINKNLCLDNAIAEYRGEETYGTDMETITTSMFEALLNGDLEDGEMNSISKRLSNDNFNEGAMKLSSKIVKIILTDESEYQGYRYKKLCLDNAIAEYHGEETYGTDMPTIAMSILNEILNNKYPESPFNKRTRRIFRTPEWIEECLSIAPDVVNVIANNKERQAPMQKLCLDNAIAEYHGEETYGTDMPTIATNMFKNFLNGELDNSNGELTPILKNERWNKGALEISKKIVNIMTTPTKSIGSYEKKMKLLNLAVEEHRNETNQ